MQFPSKVKVGHLDYKVVAMRPGEGRACSVYGQTNMTMQMIEIDTSVSVQLQASTLIHEIMHAIWVSYEFAVKAPKENRTEEEHYVSTMSAVMATVMRDNPEVFAWVQWALKGD